MATPNELPEIWMRLHNLRLLLKLMAIQGVSGRELSRVAGYGSHTYMQRVLRGEITTVTPERAARIVERLGVGMDELFVARTSSVAGDSGTTRRSVA